MSNTIDISRNGPSGVSVVETPVESNGPDFKFHFRSSRAFDETIAASRLAARLNASRIGESEHKALLKERATLLTRRLLSPLSREEENRLQYVRWSLDRIDDAKHGAELDMLEDEIARYKQALGDIMSLRGALARQLPKKKKG